MLLNTIETVAEHEEPGVKCSSVTVQRDEKIEYLHFGETPGKISFRFCFTGKGEIQHQQ